MPLDSDSDLKLLIFYFWYLGEFFVYIFWRVNGVRRTNQTLRNWFLNEGGGGAFLRKEWIIGKR
jgi:hypothetical protein